MIRSVLIVSGGAMGSLFSGFLSAASRKSATTLDVLLRANWIDHRNSIQKDGLRIHPRSEDTKNLWMNIEKSCNISGDWSEVTVRVNTVDDSIFDKHSPNYRTIDSVLLLDKSCFTEQCAQLIRNVLSENGTCLTLQNGMGNVSILQQVLGKDRVLQGSTSQAAMIEKAGTVEHTGIGYIKISAPTESGKAAADWWVQTLSSVGLEATLAGSDFERVLWEKLVINSAINPLTSLYGVKNGDLRSSQELTSLMRDIVNEGVSVAKASGIELSQTALLEKTLLVCKQTAGNISSMYSDIRKRQKTEIDFINGYIASVADQLKMDAPINKLITRLIKAKEELVIDPPDSCTLGSKNCHLIVFSNTRTLILTFFKGIIYHICKNICHSSHH